MGKSAKRKANDMSALEHFKAGVQHNRKRAKQRKDDAESPWQPLGTDKALILTVKARRLSAEQSTFNVQRRATPMQVML